MKKYNLLLCGLIAMLFSACTKDELTETNSQPSGEIVSVTAYAAGSGEDTRVSYTDQGDGSYTLAWEETESFSVIREGDNATFSKTTAGNTFTGALPSGNGDYYAVYPVSTIPTNPQQVPYDLTTQKGVLDKNMTYMYASSADGTKFEFHHSTAILKVTFNGLPAETTISRVVVTTAEANLKGNHDLVNKKLTSDSSSQQITINFASAVATDTPVFIYLPPMAADKKSLSFHVTTSNGVYAGSLDGTGGKNIEAGYVYNATEVTVSKVESYLTFTATSAGQTMKIYNNGTSANANDWFWSSNKSYKFQYSTDGVNWNDITWSNYSTKNNEGGIPFDATTYKLYLRGNFSRGTSDSSYDSKNLCIAFTDNTNKVTCTGDIRTLITFGDFTTVNTSNVTFKRLFKECKALTTAPELPATKLAEKCYYEMFLGCSSLTTAPTVLPATTLAANCYEKMFSGCTSLTAAPELPATTLAANCCYEMFSLCSSLATAPELPATTLAANCYRFMFNRCTSLTTPPAVLPATTLAESCYRSMFSGCEKLATAPELPATTLADYCYSSMFSGCEKLTTAPELPATTLAANCYHLMFSGCTSLATAPAVLPATTLADFCYHSMFSGCTSLTKTPKLPATTLANGCYQYMFNNCSNLRTVTMLATDISASGCLSNWLSGVAATGTFIKAAEMETLTEGSSGIPSGWTVNDYGAI